MEGKRCKTITMFLHLITPNLDKFRHCRGANEGTEILTRRGANGEKGVEHRRVLELMARKIRKVIGNEQALRRLKLYMK